MIVKQRGWCSISHVLPLVFDKQTPFLPSIEQINATKHVLDDVTGKLRSHGYVKDNWSVSSTLMNMPCNITDDDLHVLATGDTSSIDEEVKRQPQPRPKKNPKDKPKNYGRATHGCCSWCHCIVVKAKMRSDTCKYCKDVYNRTPDIWLKTIITNTTGHDKKASRRPPVGLTVELLQSLMMTNILLPGVPLYSNVLVCGRKYSAFVASSDRHENARSHDRDNIRMIPAMFNCVDWNRSRVKQGLVVPRDSHSHTDTTGVRKTSTFFAFYSPSTSRMLTRSDHHRRRRHRHTRSTRSSAVRTFFEYSESSSKVC
jgi:hypothetical protein